jgi:hypothetical protein
VWTVGLLPHAHAIVKGKLMLMLDWGVVVGVGGLGLKMRALADNAWDYCDMDV